MPRLWRGSRRDNVESFVKRHRQNRGLFGIIRVLKDGLPRQEVAFLGKCRKIKGCGSLREDFYTKFKPEN